MSKKVLHLNDSSDEESNQLNLNSDFAKNYDIWRRKEEIQKLKDKYGDNLDVLSDSDDQSDDSQASDDSDDQSDQSIGDNQHVFDENFFKVYSALKSRNPIIYDQNVKFFNESPIESQTEDNSNEVIDTKTKEKTLSLKEYHKKLIKEKKGITEEDEQQTNGFEDKPFGYYEELDQLKDELKSALHSDETDEQLFKGKTPSVSVDSKTKSIDFFNDDDSTEANDTDIKYLKNYWKNDKQLEDNEKFLRDYIVNKSYLNVNDRDVFSKTEFTGNDVNEDSDDNEGEDNGFETIDDTKKKAENEVKVSQFHFEEPNSVAIKRYPRSVETIRDTTNSEKRAQKRSEAKERKKREKERELKRLRKLKKEELKERLIKLQEISGNDNLDSNDLVLSQLLDDENDFDSEKYDQKMDALFGDNYYETENSAKSKPKFEFMPEIDDYECAEEDVDNSAEVEDNAKNKHKLNKKEEKKQKRIHKQMKEMGIFEDLIGGDLATRYKYRTVPSNDFGLTDEEILFSDDKELNKWCSLKKMTQYREDNEEVYDVKTYANKASNLALKQKILKSYFDKQNDNQLNEEMSSNANGKKTRKRKHKKPQFTIELMDTHKNSTSNAKEVNSDNVVKKSNKLNKSKKFKRNNNKEKSNANESSYSGVSVDRLKAYGLSNRKIKKINHKNK
ncbi:unnamed protein product [Medioppia subpectinata]|uniref:Protein KRI1 homolog n=1 Tax=Medioppia subpectinata TaxID=1979941 RepID=A0A7R9PYV7_9ACAR|nr:unnamed protein product [Medioppia subpectinata]CAG2106330.1 unnamed protein product [Medioppia subpectinata]